MASSSDHISMAVFCDFENVALGVRDAKYEKFDIKPILERLLLKGSIVVKKAYCDWERYKGFKATMHEANFELIEIPHVRQSGKNSADIRLVVDALDLCYTKAHVNTFVIISGDSDFSPLVSKLRENARQVIGVGVKQSTSDLLIANCDEFIFYDDLVRESQRAQARRAPEAAAPAARRTPEEERKRREQQDVRRTQGVELAVETFDALLSERGDSGKIWASVLKEAIKRRKPDFSESAYGFRTFGNLLEEAQARGLLAFGRDDKSGAYVYRSGQAAAAAPPVVMPPITTAVAPAVAPERSPTRYFRQEAAPAPVVEPGGPPAPHEPHGSPALHTSQAPEPTSPDAAPQPTARRGGRGGRSGRSQAAPASERTADAARAAAPEDALSAVAATDAVPAPQAPTPRGRRTRRPAAEGTAAAPPATAPGEPASSPAATAPARKAASRPRKPRASDKAAGA